MLYEVITVIGSPSSTEPYGDRTVSRNTLSESPIASASSASFVGSGSSSMKNTSMNSELSRFSWPLIRENALIRSACRVRENGHLPYSARVFWSMPRIRMLSVV